jgi:hypothetical protein
VQACAHAILDGASEDDWLWPDIPLLNIFNFGAQLQIPSVNLINLLLNVKLARIIFVTDDRRAQLVVFLVDEVIGIHIASFLPAFQLVDAYLSLKQVLEVEFLGAAKVELVFYLPVLVVDYADVAVVETVAGVSRLDVYEMETLGKMLRLRGDTRYLWQNRPITLLGHKPRAGVVNRHLFLPQVAVVHESQPGDRRRQRSRRPTDWRASCLPTG